MILLKIDNQALRKKLNHIQLVFFILAALWKKKKCEKIPTCKYC